jgi:methionyl-tRNA formyltransferase
VLPQFRAETFTAIPQQGKSSYYGGRRPEDGIISWEKEALAVYNLTRATTHPYPGAYTFLDGKKFHIWKSLPEEGPADDHPGRIVSVEPLCVQTGSGLLRLESVQLEGETEMTGEAFARLHNLENKVLGG